jgi:hypothetical protein
MLDIIEEIKNRYQVKEPIILTAFDSLAQPVFIEDDELWQLLRIYVLDELGGKITEVKEGETVGEALQRVTQKERNDARFILYLESGKVALVPHNTTR